MQELGLIDRTDHGFMYRADLKLLTLLGEQRSDTPSMIEGLAIEKLDLKYGDWSDLSLLMPHRESIERVNIRTEQCDWPFIRALPRLRGLRIGGWFSAGDWSMSGLDSLESLETYWNKGLDECIFNHEGLRFLRVHGWKLSDLGVVSGLRSLEKLHLVDSRNLASLTGIGNLERLASVILAGMPSLVSIEELSKLQRLRNLDLENCKKLNPYDVLCSCRGLVRLGIQKCQAVPSLDFVHEMANLFSIRFGGTAVEDGDVLTLLDHPSLQFAAFGNKRNFNASFMQIRDALMVRRQDAAERISAWQEPAELAKAF